jgi:hypothetical protein
MKKIFDRIKKNEMVGHTEEWERRGTYRVLVGKLEGKRPIGRPMHRWEDNIKMNFQETGWGACTGLIWFSIGTGGWLWRISSVAQELWLLKKDSAAFS